MNKLLLMMIVLLVGSGFGVVLFYVVGVMDVVLCSVVYVVD